MAPAARSFPSLRDIVVTQIVKSRSIFGQLYEHEYDLFDPVPGEIIDDILEQYFSLDAIGSNLLTANEICMLITTSTTKLDLNKLRAHRHNVPLTFIIDALGTRCQRSLYELNLSRWELEVKDIAFITFFCRNLHKLDLSFGSVTDEHITIIARNCPQLKQLNLQDQEQKFSSNGLLMIANATFQLESLTISGNCYPVQDIVTLLSTQKKLSHLRIANLIGALCRYASQSDATPLSLAHLVLLQIGSRLEDWMTGVDLSNVLCNVTALEIDLKLLSQLMEKDPKRCLGITKLSSFRDVKIRETIGNNQIAGGHLRQTVEPATYISSTWNEFLAYPCFENIEFLQLESGLQLVFFPNVSHLRRLQRLIIRNSQIVMFSEIPSNDDNAPEFLPPEFPERLTELIISNIKIGLPSRQLGELLDKSKFLDCLCLHYLSTAMPIEATKDFTSCLENILPKLKKLHISLSKRWQIESQSLLEFVLGKCGPDLKDLQINNLVLSGTDRQFWMDYVSSNYDLKFTLLE